MPSRESTDYAAVTDYLFGLKAHGAKFGIARNAECSEAEAEKMLADQKERAEERIERLLLEGLDSGEPIGITPEYWEQKRRQLLERRSGKSGHR